MLWFNFILGLNFIFHCFKLIIIHYHIQTQREIKFKPRTKLNHNIYMTVAQSLEDSFPLAKMVLKTVPHFIVLLYNRENFLQEARFELENFSHRFPMSGGRGAFRRRSGSNM